MAQSQYKRDPIKFLGAGLVTTTPPDLLPQGRQRRLRNIRIDEEMGGIKSRPGLFPINAANTLSGGVDCVRRLNDNIGIHNDFVPADAYVVTDNAGYLWVGETPEYWGAASFQRPGLGVMEYSTRGFGNRPKMMVNWRPNNSPRTWTYVFSADKMVKVGRDNNDPAAWQAFAVGCDPPQWQPDVTPTASFSGGSDDIYYRYRYRSTMTGTVSAPSPEPIYAQTTRGGASVAVRCRVLYNPEIDVIDIYRLGGSVLDYRFVGSVPNKPFGGPTYAQDFVDIIPDSVLQDQAELLEEDKWRPFATVTLPVQGYLNFTPDTPFAGVHQLDWDGGAQFPIYLFPGTQVSINFLTLGRVNSIPNYVYGWNNLATQLYVTGSFSGGFMGHCQYEIKQPLVFNKPLPYACGPFQGFCLASGDKYRPGALYWSNGNDFDSTSPTNFIEVTSPSDPLGSPFMMGGKAYVFSSERLYAIYPAFDQVNQFSVIETSCQRGLLFNWAFCTDGERQGGKCWFLAKDGIYETTGAESVCITDELYNLFPHEGTQSNPTTSSSWLNPIDLTPGGADRVWLKLEFNQGNVYFSYLDLTGAAITLVYSTRTKTWQSADIYATTGKCRVLYSGEGREKAELILGTADGRLCRMQEDYQTDLGFSYTCNVRTSSNDFGDPGTRKLIGDVTYEYISPGNPLVATAYLDNEVTNAGSDVAPTTATRLQRIIDINALGRNVALDWAWGPVQGQSPTVLYLWMPSATPKPETEQKRWQDWHNFLEDGIDAYVTGLIIHCSTQTGAIVNTKTIQIWSDNAYTGNTFTFSAAGEQELEFSWPVFKGKLARIVPTDSNPWQVFKWEWKAEKEPLDLGHWDTNWKPATENNENGYVTGVTIEADTHNVQKALTFQYELEGVVYNPVILSLNSFATWNGRTNHSFTFEPFRAQQLRFFSDDNVIGRLYDWKWWVSPEPPVLSNFNANWEDGGYLGAKFLQGLIIDADTQGQSKEVDIESEDGIICTLIVNHTKRQGKAYSLPYAHVVNKIRAIPRDPNPSWLYKIEWKFQAHPESVWSWETQFTSHGLMGFWHLRDGYIAYESDSIVYFVVTLDDGTKYAIILPNTNRVYRKCYVVFPPFKQKLASYKLSTFLGDPSTPILYTASLTD